MTSLLIRLGLDLLMVTLLILAVYYRRHRSPDYVFTCFVINAVTFLLCFLMRNASGALTYWLADGSGDDFVESSLLYSVPNDWQVIDYFV